MTENHKIRVTPSCAECGAELGSTGSCMEDYFYALLHLESEIPGGPGEIAHFYAVASYGVQHPRSLGYTRETLVGLRAALGAMVAGTADLDDVRRRARYHAANAGRVTRRSGDAIAGWETRRWPMTVTDVLEKGAEGYQASVERWARSIIETLRGREPVDAGERE
jgi:hypothetical protein